MKKPLEWFAPYERPWLRHTQWKRERGQHWANA